jgi:lipopolysaccharide export system protein LptA
MTFPKITGLGWYCFLPVILLLHAGPVSALESDRQQPLEVHADSTDGTLGDGIAVLRGNVEIQQGSLLVQADVAEVEKVEGRVRTVILTGQPVKLQQDIEDQGLVTALARRIEYEVASGIITLIGEADVVHPQYSVKGEILKYDLKLQHFQGSGGDGNGRIRIQLDPEIVPEVGLEPDSTVSGEPKNNEASVPDGLQVSEPDEDPSGDSDK